MMEDQTEQQSKYDRMWAEQAHLARRWDEVAARARRFDWKGAGLATVAGKVDLDWIRLRGDEQVSDFLALDGDSLLALPGFGVGKLRRLCSILEAVMASGGADLLASEEPLEVEEPRDPFEALAEWGVPADLPVLLVSLPSIMIKHCITHGLDTLDRVLDEWAAVGPAGFLSRKGLGKLSVMPLKEFVDSLLEKDRKAASAFLPLHPSGSGLSLGLALDKLADAQTPTERTVLTRRLVEEKPLVQCKCAHVQTREGVRQVESRFLLPARHWIHHFDKERLEMLVNWLDGGDWFAPLRDEVSRNNQTLVKAALEDAFRSSPQATDLARKETARLEQFQRELQENRELWFGGVSLAGFLKSHVPEEDQVEFFRLLRRSTELRIDPNGTVVPVVTTLRQTVLGLLAVEKKPVKLTRLIRLLHRTGYHPHITPYLLRQRRIEWLRHSLIPKNMILWDE